MQRHVKEEDYEKFKGTYFNRGSEKLCQTIQKSLDTADDEAKTPITFMSLLENDVKKKLQEDVEKKMMTSTLPSLFPAPSTYEHYLDPSLGLYTLDCPDLTTLYASKAEENLRCCEAITEAMNETGVQVMVDKMRQIKGEPQNE